MDASFWASFRSLDDSPDPDALIRFLDAFAALAPVREGKARSLELLGVAAGASVLDVGCGVGDDVVELARRLGPGGRAVGVDASARAIEVARERAREAGVDAEYRVADATTLPFDDGEFDACRTDRTLQHLASPESALREMARVTRAGGRVVATESTTTATADEVGDELAAAFGAGNRGGGWVTYFLPVLMDRAGLVDVAVKTGGGRIEPEDAARVLAPVERALERAGSADARAWLDGFRRARRDGRLELDVRLYDFVSWVPDAGDARRSSHGGASPAG